MFLLDLVAGDPVVEVAFRREAGLHEEFKHKVTNAQAKEEGSVMEESRIFKKINTLESKNFHLEDSDDEDSIVSPEVNRFRQTFSTFQSGISLFAMAEKEFCRDT